MADSFVHVIRKQMSSTILLTVGGSRKKDEAVRFFKNF